jgi:hypothetical protein
MVFHWTRKAIVLPDPQLGPVDLDQRHEVEDVMADHRPH